MSIVVLYCIVSFAAGWVLSARWVRSTCSRPAPCGAGRYLGAFSFCFILACGLAPRVQAQDTIRTLDEVEVSTQRTPTTLRTAAPTQVMDAATIEQAGAVQLSDAVRKMAGVTLKDYGGVGGMKTVSARGLGSQFSTVTIDGVAVDNAQNGQVDLGRYLLGNAAYVSLSQGQEQRPLLSARAYAAGNVLNLETAEPRFFLTQRTNLRVGVEGGSFGFLSPTLLWEQRWGKRLKSSLWAGYLQSNGDYPFTLYYTASHTDSSSRERRLHSAMRQFTADANLFYTIAKGNSITAKFHLMNGRHQLPGHVRLYRQEPSAENTAENLLFAQAKWRMERERWRVQVLGKVQHSNDMYEDSAATTITGYLMNEYRQGEGYLSASGEWDATSWLTLCAAADGDISHLHSNLGQRNDVQRSNLMGVVAARAHKGPFELRTNLLATSIVDRVADLDTMPTFRRLSPYAALMYTPVMGLTLRYFYKDTYRAPNFSELYFFQSLPRNLRPEHARQHNLGVTYANNIISATLDAYVNRVIDKIVARPGQNMFYWSMENLGLVQILGIDATVELHISSLELRGNYSFMHAVDLSDPSSSYYGHQIRYTPRHSGGGSLRWENRWVNVGATAMVVGHRYAYPQNNADNRMPAYCDIGISFDRKFDLRLGTLRLQAQVLNLLDTQYEVILFYPMMGRNYRFGISYEF